MLADYTRGARGAEFLPDGWARWEREILKATARIPVRTTGRLVRLAENLHHLLFRKSLSIGVARANRARENETDEDRRPTRKAGRHGDRSALLLGYLGTIDKDRALNMIERGYAERDNYEVNIVADPLMAPLRREPRLEAMCRLVMFGTDSRSPSGVPSGAWSAPTAPDLITFDLHAASAGT